MVPMMGTDSSADNTALQILRCKASSLMISLHEATPISALVSFRIVFGLLLLYTNIRTWDKGWIQELYIEPTYHFPFVEGLEPLGGVGMYMVFGLMTLSAFGIILGAFYRVSAITHLICFLYVELLDKTYYLNHYYLVTLLVFWLCCTDGHRQLSIDAWLRPSIRTCTVPWWQIGIFKIQLSVVYFFAGLAKVNPDWLIKGQPLATWLPGLYQIPLLGQFVHFPWLAKAFSWAGCIYDLTIWVFLWIGRTRGYAYVAVVVFHVLTAILFPRIGMFPYIMMTSTVIFFSDRWHTKFLQSISFNKYPLTVDQTSNYLKKTPHTFVSILLATYILLQLYLPLRHLQYDGNLFWHEQGYRFSWRVMLMEKNGYTSIVIKDPKTGKSKEVEQCDFLTAFQQQQMRSQPDMLLQFAHDLGDDFTVKNGYAPEIYIKSQLSLNGRRSQPFTDDKINIYQHPNPMNMGWILPFKEVQ